MSSLSDIDDNLGKFGAIHSSELALSLRLNLLYLYSGLSVGAIAPIMTNIPGVPNPNPNIWQECNGSEITNPNSPFRSLPGAQRFTPNLLDRYLRITTSLGTVGQSGGVNNFSGWGHTHIVQNNVESPSTGGEDKDGNNLVVVHTHEMGARLDTLTTNMEPTFYTLKYFMRIQ